VLFIVVAVSTQYVNRVEEKSYERPGKRMAESSYRTGDEGNLGIRSNEMAGSALPWIERCPVPIWRQMSAHTSMKRKKERTLPLLGGDKVDEVVEKE
jgi:hypothetical protein